MPMIAATTATRMISHWLLAETSGAAASTNNEMLGNTAATPYMKFGKAERRPQSTWRAARPGLAFREAARKEPPSRFEPQQRTTLGSRAQVRQLFRLAALRRDFNCLR